MTAQESKSIVAEAKARFPATPGQLEDLAQATTKLNYGRVLACIKNYAIRPQNHSQFEWLGHLCELIRQDTERMNLVRRKIKTEKIVDGLRHYGRTSWGKTEWEGMNDLGVIIDHFGGLMKELTPENDTPQIRLYLLRTARIAMNEIGIVGSEAVQMSRQIVEMEDHRAVAAEVIKEQTGRLPLLEGLCK